ncbi:type III-B CRISPR module RAMP protein Cmr1 [Marinomonas mediterranea]|uniref:type III-B CRISPR module RAMP protein Cmr1 n=1 Tax=Marinomonas mediterranea TaxID=119864 RepID=UPI00300DE1CC
MTPLLSEYLRQRKEIIVARTRLVDSSQLDALQSALSSLDQESQWQTYECTLITPMYGGGVEAGEVDKQMPIRASEIRGHLRFWWRLLYGTQDSKETFDREKAIWGGIAANPKDIKKSLVSIKVTTHAPIHLKPSTTYTDVKNGNTNKINKNSLGYAFGAASILTENEEDICWLSEGTRFTLYIKLDIPEPSHKNKEDIEEQINSSIKYWANFGGLGARTRRGFGSIYSSAFSIKSNTEIESLIKKLTNSKFALLQSKSASAVTAWETASQRLSSFRQIGIGRKSHKNRSTWPEPDQLRRFTDKNDNGKHKPEHKAGNVFPRAAFGMPILFKFKSSSDPQTLRLLPQGAERFASPLIIRPIQLQEGCVAIALLLPNWQQALTQELELQTEKDDTFLVANKEPPMSWGERNGAELASLITPMQGRADNPLEAFLDYFEKGR